MYRFASFIERCFAEIIVKTTVPLRFTVSKKVCGRRFPTLRMENEYNTYFTEKSVATLKCPAFSRFFLSFFHLSKFANSVCGLPHTRANFGGKKPREILYVICSFVPLLHYGFTCVQNCFNRV